MKKIFVSALLSCFLVNLVISSVHLDVFSNEINNFISSDWEQVNKAKLYLENKQEESIPALVELLDEDTVVKLKNTGDLIYPGAEKFYGHGQIIDYDIDNLIIRAGWIIEEITFQDFGFSTIHDRDEKLLEHIKQEYKKYLSQDYLNKLEKSTPAEIRNEMKKMASKKAAEWWEENEKEWDRFQGIVDALHSSNNRRQILALQYLRTGKSKCDGLTIESYLDNIKDRVAYLSKSNINRIAEQAKLVLNDHDFEFIKIKTE